MKKLLISVLVCAMMVTGCSSSKKESKTTEQTVAQSNFTQDLKELFEEDEYKEFKDEYNITDCKKVDDSNSDSFIKKMKKAIENNENVVIAVGLGIIVIAGVAYVIYDPSIIPTIADYLKTLLSNEDFCDAVKLLKKGVLYTLFDYYNNGHDWNNAFQNGMKYALSNIK